MLIFTAKQDCMSQDLQNLLLDLLVATLTALALS